MLKFLSKSVKKLFGTKYDKDIAIYQPLVDQALIEYDKLSGLSDDQLRNKTNDFRARIKEYLSEIDADIAKMKEDATAQNDLQAKEEKKRREDSQRILLLQLLLPTMIEK